MAYTRLNGLFLLEPGSVVSTSLYGTGKSAWAAYYFGKHRGTMYIPERPTRATNEKYPLYWRRRKSHDGQTNTGWMRFLGDGRIEGLINCDGEVKFHGDILPFSKRRRVRSLNSIKYEWNGYKKE